MCGRWIHGLSGIWCSCAGLRRRLRRRSRSRSRRSRLHDVTVLIPTLRERNEQWLREAIGSLPAGVPYLLLDNDPGELHLAFNEGLRLADTEWVLSFSNDDVCGPQMIELLLMFGTDADVVYPQMTLVSEDLSTVLSVHDADPFCGNRLMQDNYISGVALIRRAKALEVGGLRDLKFLEDWDLWVRMFRAGARFKACPEAKLLYRQHDGSRNKVQGEDYDAAMAEMRALIVGDERPPTPLATFYSQATAAQTYLRCQLPSRVLPGVVRGRLSGYDTGGELIEFPEHVGAAVFSYPGDRITAAMLLNMKEQGIRTLVEVDDNYLINPGRAVLNRSQWGLKIGERENTRAGHRLIAGYADGITVTTRFLADRYLRFNKHVFVCPNTVDPADWPVVRKPDDGVLRICWFASNSHDTDIPLITRAFEWCSRQQDVQVFVAGIDPGWRFEYGHLPWIHDLAAYRHAWSHFDVSVAPIVETPHGLGRSDLKVLEASMGGCASVVSDLPPYEFWGDEVLRAKDAKGFLHQLKRLVADRGEVKALAAAARVRVLAERTNVAQRDAWLEAVTDDAGTKRRAA